MTGYFPCFQQMRAVSKSWISSVFLGVLALSFRRVGRCPDIFPRRAAMTTVSATVRRTRKSAAPEFERELSHGPPAPMRVRAPVTRSQPRKAATPQGFDRQVLQQKIDQLAEDHIIGKLMAWSSAAAQVSATIRGIPAFRGVLGGFDHCDFPSGS